MNALFEIGLTHFLVVGALVFALGVMTVATRRNAVAILMGIELMLNASVINFLAFWRYVNPNVALSGQAFAVFVITLAAAEVSVGLALIIAIYRNRDTVVVDDVDLMKG